jgi:hypothetical protein
LCGQIGGGSDSFFGQSSIEFDRVFRDLSRFESNAYSLQERKSTKAKVSLKRFDSIGSDLTQELNSYVL